MNELETKQAIVTSLAGCATKPLAAAATAIFESLGYKSQKRITLKPNSVETFIATFAKDKPLNPEHALLADWQSVDFLFQLTDDEVRAAAQGDQSFLFESKGKWDGAAMESYLFFAITLAKPHYSRTELSGITRAVNRLFPMPAMLLFRHGDTLTLAVNNRRLHKRDESKDVLEKVTLIKDIRFANPHRAHVEILSDLSFDALRDKHDFANFVTLHAAWQKSLDSSKLNKRFFTEVANWYFWALHHIEFPKDAPKQDGKDHISVIRLITRLMFVWFIKEKGLVPDLLFDERKLPQILHGFEPLNPTTPLPSLSSPSEGEERVAVGRERSGRGKVHGEGRGEGGRSVYYRAILQNLFFATLNTEMDKRGWTKEEQNFMAHSLYRFRESFQKPDAALDLFKNIPFLNGGLFECLDKDLGLPAEASAKAGENAKPRYVRIDGFSRREDSQPIVPDFLFFGPEREVDLSADYGDNKFKKVKVRGLIHTLNHYKFTVAENTPIEEEIALDPELSGKVFENLLAAYNPETGATARKQTGSFYTPREIVNYMVDEALIACLKTKLDARPHPGPLPRGEGDTSSVAQQNDASTTQVAPIATSAANDSPSPGGEGRGEGGRSLSTINSQLSTESKLRHLFAYNDEPHQFTAPEVDALIAAIDSLKSLDPAVGSGAFPMGILHKLVFILGKLDPRNEKWKERQIARVRDAMTAAEKIEDATVRERAVRELEQQITGINEAFEHNELDYGRKLYLIENCIYGVDIQPIAVQIAKMRFFISLIVDQKIDDTQPNRGVRPLPNLETKFVAANTLIGVNRPGQQLLRNREIDAKEAKLREVRRSHFLARTLTQKRKCREQDEKLRAEIAELLKGDGWDKDTATKLASWNPYDQNASADFFDAEWMFGITEGFDICEGNPPYIFARNSAAKGLTERDKRYFYENYELAEYQINLYPLFIEKGTQLLNSSGVLCFITPNNWLTINTNRKLRQFILVQSKVSILNFYARVFESADVDAAIVLFQTGNTHSKTENVRLLEWTTEAELIVDAPKSQFLSQADAVINIEALKSGETGDLMTKIEKGTRPLKEIASVKCGLGAYGRGDGIPPQTDEMIEARVYHSKKKKGDEWFKYVEGVDVKRYSLGWLREEYLKWGRHLREPRNDWKLFSTPRILVRQIPSPPPYCINACFTVETFLNDRNSMNIINIAIKPQLVLAVLNSRLMTYWFIHKFGKMQRGIFPQFKINELAIFPIPRSFAPHEESLIASVERILVAKKQNPVADTSALEREIDQQVYALYGLTPEEIKIVEEASK